MTTMSAEQTRAAWDQIAVAYDTHVTTRRGKVPEEALRRAEVLPGRKFLDVASGSGALSLPAARYGAKVLAVDLSPVMIDRLREHAAEEKLTNLEARVMDGHNLELEDDSFDVAGSSFGVMLFPDLPRGLREMVRVTKPGGRVFMVSFAPPEEVEFLKLFFGAVKANAPGFPGLPRDALPFQVAEREKLQRAMEAAGLRDVRVERTSEELSFRNGAEMWAWCMSSNPIAGMTVAGLTPDQRAAVQRTLDDQLRARAGADGTAVLQNAIHIGVGTK